MPPNLETRLGARSQPLPTGRKALASQGKGQMIKIVGRSANEKNRPSKTKMKTCQSDCGATTSSRSETRSETTGTSRGERRPDRSSLMWSSSIPSPWHVYKQELMNLKLQTVRFAADAMRMLNGARLPVNRLYLITSVDWKIAATTNFSSTTALRFAHLEGLHSNNTMGPVNARPLQDRKLNHDKGN